MDDDHNMEIDDEVHINTKHLRLRIKLSRNQDYQGRQRGQTNQNIVIPIEKCHGENYHLSKDKSIQ